MLFWRIFLIAFGIVFGAILGLDLVALLRWPGVLLILILGGALLGGTFGWALSVFMPKAVEWLRVWLPDHSPTAPPRDVLHLGRSLGIAEGIVVGVTYGGVLAAVVGGCFGMMLGSGTATLSWYVRRHIPLVLLTLSLGSLIELSGCLLIVWFIQSLALQPLSMWAYSGMLVLAFFLRLFRDRRVSSAQQE